MLVAALALLGFVLMLVVGLPLVAKLADHQLYNAPKAPMDHTPRRVYAARSITPPDFGPVRMKWPSETPRPDHDRLTRPELYWPSSRWDDPSFGKSAANRKAEAASAAAEAGAASAQRRWIAAAQAAMPASHDAPPAPPTTPQRPAQRSSSGGERTKPPSRPVGPPPRRQHSQREPAPAQEPQTHPELPSAPQIRQLIQQHGSVAASRILAEQTGLDTERVVDLVLDAMKD